MSTTPLGSTAGGTGPLRPRTNRLQTAPLPAMPDTGSLALDRRQISAAAQATPSGPSILLKVKQAELEQKKQLLAQKEADLAAAQAPRGLWNRMTAWSEKVVEGLKKEIAQLRQQIATLEAAIADLVKNGAHALSEGISATAGSLRAGKGVMASLESGVDAAGTTVVRDVVDPLLDRTALGKAEEAADRHAVLGPVLTDRLAMGESARLKLEAGATLPLEALGIPNARLDGAGTLEIKRVPRLGRDGLPLTEPRDARGMPPSELKVTITVEGQAGAFYSAEAGVQGGLDVGTHTVGLNASARAEAEAGLRGRAAITFSFDPQKADDMDALGGMIKATAETGALATFPGLGPFLGSAEAVRHAEAFRQFGRRIESLEGEGGLYAQANASLSADAGLFEQLDADRAGKTRKTYTDRGSELTSFDELCRNIGALEGALGGEAKVGGRVNLRTGEKTLLVTMKGSAHSGAYLAALGKDADAAADRKLALTYDKEGHLKAVRVQTEVTKAQFEGIKTTVEDIYGRPLNPGVVAGIGDEDRVRISYELKPEHLERIGRHLAGSVSEKASALEELAGMTIDPDTVKLKQGDVVALHQDSFTIGGSVRVSMGAVAGLRARLTLARGQESVVD